jgi:hypothetical protein
VEWRLQTAANRTTKTKKSLYGYARPGRPPPFVDDRLVAALGPKYYEQAAERLSWIEQREVLLGKGPGLRHFSNRTDDWMAGAVGAVVPLKVLHMSDSELVVSKANGTWHNKTEDFAPYIRTLRFSAHLLQDVLKCKPVQLFNPVFTLLHHIPRSFNNLPDFVCNKMMDEGIDYEAFHPEWENAAPHFTSGIQILLWSDGGARSTCAAAAACLAILVRVDSEQVHNSSVQNSAFCVSLDDNLYRSEIVAVKGVRLQAVSSNTAEFEAACLARRLLFQWLHFAKLLV